MSDTSRAPGRPFSHRCPAHAAGMRENQARTRRAAGSAGTDRATCIRDRCPKHACRLRNPPRAAVACRQTAGQVPARYLGASVTRPSARLDSLPSGAPIRTLARPARRASSFPRQSPAGCFRNGGTSWPAAAVTTRSLTRRRARKTSPHAPAWLPTTFSAVGPGAGGVSARAPRAVRDDGSRLASDADAPETER